MTSYESLAQVGITLTSVLTARAALTYLTTLSEAVMKARSTTGASLRRASSALATLTSSSDAYAAAESRIRDIDAAEEVAGLTKLQILRETQTGILAQANQQSGIALQLLRF